MSADSTISCHQVRNKASFDVLLSSQAQGGREQAAQSTLLLPLGVCVLFNLSTILEHFKVLVRNL